MLRFIDGHETETAVYIVTEAVSPLTARIGTEGQQPGQGEEWKVWGLSRIVVGCHSDIEYDCEGISNLDTATDRPPVHKYIRSKHAWQLAPIFYIHFTKRRMEVRRFRGAKHFEGCIACTICMWTDVAKASQTIEADF